MVRQARPQGQCESVLNSARGDSTHRGSRVECSKLLGQVRCDGWVVPVPHEVQIVQAAGARAAPSGAGCWGPRAPAGGGRSRRLATTSRGRRSRRCAAPGIVSGRHAQRRADSLATAARSARPGARRERRHMAPGASRRQAGSPGVGDCSQRQAGGQLVGGQVGVQVGQRLPAVVLLAPAQPPGGWEGGGTGGAGKARQWAAGVTGGAEQLPPPAAAAPPTAAPPSPTARSRAGRQLGQSGAHTPATHRSSPLHRQPACHTHLTKNSRAPPSPRTPSSISTS